MAASISAIDYTFQWQQHEEIPSFWGIAVEKSRCDDCPEDGMVLVREEGERATVDANFRIFPEFCREVVNTISTITTRRRSPF
jgi:hypothetical protein